jgi:hypothetical protein
LGPTTLYGHAERGRSNRKVCLLFNRRRVHKGENYIWQGWEVPNAENSACPLRSRRKFAAHHYKISSDDQGISGRLMGGVPDTDKKVGWSPSHRRLIKKLSIFLPFFRASTIHLGLWPLPAQVSPDGLRYFGETRGGLGCLNSFSASISGARACRHPPFFS